ncbi:MAG: Na+ dependent nucleoside transporter N-terminal domain-containing protein, partial [Rhodothermales bacterium]
MDFIVGLLRGLLGLVVILGIALLFSNNRRKVNWRTVGAGLGLQLGLAIFILKGEAMGAFFAPLGWPKAFFSWLSGFFVKVLEFTTAGSQFIFGDLAVDQSNVGTFFAFQVL